MEYVKYPIDSCSEIARLRYRPRVAPTTEHLRAAVRMLFLLVLEVYEPIVFVHFLLDIC
jgi:hypothetical protein